MQTSSKPEGGPLRSHQHPVGIPETPLPAGHSIAYAKEQSMDNPAERTLTGTRMARYGDGEEGPVGDGKNVDVGNKRRSSSLDFPF